MLAFSGMLYPILISWTPPLSEGSHLFFIEVGECIGLVLGREGGRFVSNNAARYHESISCVRLCKHLDMTHHAHPQRGIRYLIESIKKEEKVPLLKLRLDKIGKCSQIIVVKVDW